ncbi:RNA polymerase sigma factor [Salipiger sp. H15]|uniref:RNA polymerase sigma factor n=1 Tax=Alloyangia sp. H15 TaxID=3029062 RepID=A0AAU8AFN8_9RHOB
MTPTDPVQDLYRRENRRVFATLVRLLGDFDLAEDALQSAFLAAAQRWPRDGVPGNPVAWLVSAGRFRAIDALRRDRRMTPWSEAAEAAAEIPDGAMPPEDREAVEDDRLRLIFTCCHPSLSEEAAVALTLREICGLSTEAIARAFLVAPSTLAQRIVRAKSKIRDARIPYEVPETEALPARLGRVLRVVYLVFNEGHLAAQGSDLLRPDLTAEAIRLARLLAELIPDPEVLGLLALLLLQDSRRRARVTGAGDLVPLEAQDRTLWDREAIAEGTALVRRALGTRGFGSYALQAAIAALHAESPTPGATDWAEIAGLYDALLRIEPSPVIALNRAVAVAMRDGPDAGLALIEPLLAPGLLGGYHLAHAAKADLLRRAGRLGPARTSYEAALKLARQEPERRFLTARLAEIGG